MEDDLLREWKALQARAQEEEDPATLAAIIDEMNQILTVLERQQATGRPVVHAPTRRGRSSVSHEARKPSQFGT